MANNYKIFNKGFGVVPKASSQSTENGDLEALLSDGKLRYYNVNQATPNSPVVTEAHTATLTNKTIDADNNTISDLTNANLKNGVAAIANNNLAEMPDQTIKGNVSGSLAVPDDLTAVQVNTMLGTTGAATSIGDFDTPPASIKGLSLVGQQIIAQSATTTEPGMVNTANQTFAGVKSFNKLALTQSVDNSSTGANVNVAAPSVGTIIFTNASLTSIQNIGAGATGQLLTIKNSTSVTITIVNDSGGTAANRIVTGTGGNLSLLTTACLFLVYDANASRWTVIGGSGGGSGNLAVNNFTGDGTTTLFTLSVDPITENNTWVYLSGVYQDKSTYSVSGTALTFSTPPPNTVGIEVVIGQTTSIGVPADDTVTIAKLAADVLEYLIPTGTILPFGGFSGVTPTGFLVCDGSAVSRTTFLNLYSVIGDQFGEGNGSTTFNVPDFRGRFLRGVDGAAGRDPDSASRTAMNPGGNTGNTVGSVQGDSFASHTHDVDFFSGGLSTQLFNGGTDGPTLRGSETSTSTGGNETRPINAYVNYIIKT